MAHGEGFRTCLFAPCSQTTWERAFYKHSWQVGRVKILTSRSSASWRPLTTREIYWTPISSYDLERSSSWGPETSETIGKRFGRSAMRCNVVLVNRSFYNSKVIPSRISLLYWEISFGGNEAELSRKVRSLASFSLPWGCSSPVMSDHDNSSSVST